MKSMQRRMVAAMALLAASLAGLVMSTHRYVWPGASPAPLWIPAPPHAAIVPRPAFPTETRAVMVKPGDTLARVIARGGLETRVANDLAAQFGRNGAALRKLRPGATVEIVWNFRKEPIEVR